MELLQQKNIMVVLQPIASLQGKNGKIKNIVLKNGEKQRCDALFFSRVMKRNVTLLKLLVAILEKPN